MNTVLPKAVQDQLDAAEKLQQELSNPTPAPAEPEVEQPEATPAQEPAAQEPVQAQPQDDAAYWKQRFDTMQGKYNAEVPRLHQHNRELEARFSDLERKLTEKPAEPQKKSESLLTPKDIEEYGEDLIDVMRRAAQEQANAGAGEILGKMQERIQQLESQLGAVNGTVAATLEDKFYATLASRVPDWEAVNKDQAFLNWLSESDPMSGKTKWDYLNEAHGRMDVDRVSAIFVSFKAAHSAPAKAAANELQRQVAPAKNGAAAPNVDAGKRLWTLAEYQNAWDHRLAQKMDAKEIEALRAEADLALAEGRMR